nr:hypothetical protein [Nocardia donostiensis]
MPEASGALWGADSPAASEQNARRSLWADAVAAAVLIHEETA